MLTKSDVQKKIADLEAQEKQMFANLNYLLGQKSVLASMLPELPEDPVPEGELPELGQVQCEEPVEPPADVIPFDPTRGKKGK